MVRMAVIGLRGVPDVMGGIETHCSALLPRLIGHAAPGIIEIAVLARRPYVTHAGVSGALRQIPLWAPRSQALETVVHTVWALLYARVVLRADIVHLHAVGPGLFAPLARLLGFRVLFTHHGEDYRRQKWGRLASAVLRVGETLGTLSAHRVITVSRASARRLSARFPGKSDRIRFIPNGLSTDAGATSAEPHLAELGLTPGRYVISVGRLVPEKGQDLLIDAFQASAMAKADPPWKLLIVGDADHESAYSRQVIAKAQADDRIVLSGRTPRNVVMALNRQAGLFVLPSLHEGLSIAALEAIHAGAPILVSDIEANRLLGMPDAHHFRSGSVASLASRLDPAGVSALRLKSFDIGAFDWDTIARNTLMEVDALLAANEGRLVNPDFFPGQAR